MQYVYVGHKTSWFPSQLAKMVWLGGWVRVLGHVCVGQFVESTSFIIRRAEF